MHRRLRDVAALIFSAGFASASLAVPIEAPRLPPPPAQIATPIDQTYAQALRKFVDGDLAGAEKLFQQVLALQRNHVPALLGLAEIAFRQQQPQKVGTLLGQAVKADPGDAYAQASMGRYLAVNKRYPEAEVALKRAVELSATLVRPRMDLADLYATALKQPKLALSLYQDVLTIEPKHAGAHYALGVALAKEGDYDKARAALEKAARLEPNNPLPAVALAQVSMRRKAYDDAMGWVNQALKIQPTLAGALELRGDLNDIRKDPRQALADYQAAIRAAPGLASAHFKLGFMQQRLNHVKEAMQAYRDAVKFAPGLAPAYNNLAWLAVQNGIELPQAEGWARQAVKLDPRNPANLDTLGWVLHARGQFAEAEKSLRASLRLNRSADTFYHLGMVLQGAGKRAEAEKAFRDALSLDPRHAEATQALGGMKR